MLEGPDQCAAVQRMGPPRDWDVVDGVRGTHQHAVEPHHVVGIDEPEPGDDLQVRGVPVEPPLVGKPLGEQVEFAGMQGGFGLDAGDSAHTGYLRW